MRWINPLLDEMESLMDTNYRIVLIVIWLLIGYLGYLVMFPEPHGTLKQRHIVLGSILKGIFVAAVPADIFLLKDLTLLVVAGFLFVFWVFFPKALGKYVRSLPTKTTS